MRSLPFLALCSGCGLIALTAFSPAQQTQAQSQTQASTQSQTQSSDSGSSSKQNSPPKKATVARPMTEREKKKQEAKLKKELESPWKKWLNEDVVYIITDEEKKAFKQLQTDEEREQFVENFWLKRDPTPDTEENEFREEHYRRIAYANEHFASGIPGWKSDRGRIYIEYGPPDEIESHPSGGTYERPYEEGGGTTSTYPFEQWRYRYIEGIGNNIIIEFVDTTMSGEYHMTMDPSEKDALLYVPNAGLTLMEQMGLACKTQRFTRTDGTHLGTGSMPLPESMNEFTRLETFAKLQAPPAIKYPDLEALVTSNIKYNLLPMKVQADYIPLTESSVLTLITIQFDRKDLQYKDKGGVSTATVNLYGRVTTLARRPATWFEEAVQVDEPTEMLQQAMSGVSIYQKTVPLKPGRYRLSIAATDVVGGNKTVFEKALDVPRVEDDVLGSSSLILADTIEKMPPKNIGIGQFVIGDRKVRPRMDATFKRTEPLGIYFQLYNFQADEKTHKPKGTIEYDFYKAGTNEMVGDPIVEDLASSLATPNSGIEGGATQVTVEHLLPLKDFKPGAYTLKIKIVDGLRNATINDSANFTVL
ncbi:MAG TPA: GWxTD domain-containing protein [Bryobacteraceae bacterium]|nr:GWxTD domain-containing protein [Bryobacteraceae bacterium]